MDLQIERLDPIETPTSEQFWGGFATGVATALAVVAVTGVVIVVAT